MRPDDFERLYEEHAQRLFGFLVYRTGDRALAEDVMADTFESALRAHARFDRRKGSARTWLYTIALNRLRDVQRRVDAEQRALSRASAGAPDSVEPATEQLAHRDQLSRAMQVLSPEEREAVALRFAADLSLKEIATVTGESMSTAEARVYRALRKLRAELE